MQNKDEAKESTILQRMLMDERLNVPGAMVAVADLIMAGIDTVSYFSLLLFCYYRTKISLSLNKSRLVL